MIGAGDDFGGNLDEDEPQGQAPANVIPFPAMRANVKVTEAWERERKAINDRDKAAHRMISPLDAIADMERKRKLPVLPWPQQWGELAKRCRLYAGECIGIVGPTGGGKTSFGIQLGRAATAEGIPVIWAPLELEPVELNYRIVGNMTATHTGKIRDHWTSQDIAHKLSAITDLWRYADRYIDPERQLAAIWSMVEAAKRIYRMPPLVVIDYIGKLSALDRDPRTATRIHAESIRAATVALECYTAILAQPSRQNNATLTGKTELESASDAIAVAGESGEIEHACSVMIGLNVFKEDDKMALDAHALVSKARGTGREGRQGMRFHKPGGVWQELDYVPATPSEVRTEIKRAKKDKLRTVEPTPESARQDVNASRAGDADASRRRAVREALEKRGMMGMTMAELRKVPGTGRAQRLSQTLQELERMGDVERATGGKWRLILRLT